MSPGETRGTPPFEKVCGSVSEPGISFMVVNFNMAGLVYELIENIRRQVMAVCPYEIIIGDNSTDKAFQIDDRFNNAADVLLTRLPSNEGFVSAVSLLLRQPKYKYIALLHPDVDFMENCISQLIVFMEANPEAGIVSPNLIYPDGVGNKIRLRFATPFTECRRVLNLMARGMIKRNIMNDEYLWDRRSDIIVDMTMSVCMVIRSEVLSKIGRINIAMWTYYLNDWLGFQARHAGYTCHYLRDAVAVHYERFADTSLYSRKEDSAYKRTAIPVEERMLKDWFVFLRDTNSFGTILVFKLIKIVEYLYLIMVSAPRYHERRQDISAYCKALNIVYRA